MTGRSGAELELGRGTEKGMEEEGSADSWARSVGEREEAAATRSLRGKGADMWARPVSEEGARGPCAGAA